MCGFLCDHAVAPFRHVWASRTAACGCDAHTAYATQRYVETTDLSYDTRAHEQRAELRPVPHQLFVDPAGGQRPPLYRFAVGHAVGFRPPELRVSCAVLGMLGEASELRRDIVG